MPRELEQRHALVQSSPATHPTTRDESAGAAMPRMPAVGRKSRQERLPIARKEARDAVFPEILKVGAWDGFRQGYNAISPRRTARRTASVRLPAPSFPLIEPM